MEVVESPAARMPATAELQRLFVAKYGRPDETGWAPSRRWRAGYFLPSDHYEALVESLVRPGCRWLDIGGGHNIFPDNAALATYLAKMCREVVAVDPSDNVHRNTFVDRSIRVSLEDFDVAEPFDLATLRMVAEHVEDPSRFSEALRRVVRPGGHLVVLTVGRWAPVTIVSRLVPFGLHYSVKRVVWPGDPADTFPTFYRLNSRATLNRHLTQAGFEEAAFRRLDDLSVFGRHRVLNAMELAARAALRRVGLGYPEHCLLGLYRRLP